MILFVRQELPEQEFKERRQSIAQYSPSFSLVEKFHFGGIGCTLSDAEGVWFFF
jgi:hypothetical protein